MMRKVMVIADDEIAKRNVKGIASNHNAYPQHFQRIVGT